MSNYDDRFVAYYKEIPASMAEKLVNQFNDRFKEPDIPSLLKKLGIPIEDLEKEKADE